jgi:multidrug efflux system membrane fusion protein
MDRQQLQTRPPEILVETKTEQPRLFPEPAPRRRWILWVVLVVVVVGALLTIILLRDRGQSKAAGRGTQTGPINVVVTKAITSDVPIYIQGPGTVTSLATVTVHSRVDGQLIKVGFTEGQKVKEGDFLALIDPGPYQAALEQAQGQLLKDQALLADAQLDLKRYTGAPAGTYTPQQIDTQKALVMQDEGIVKSDQGNVDSAQVNLQYCTITSPTDGQIGLRLVDPGNIVNTTDTTGIAVIAKLQPISVIFPITEDQIPQVLNKPHLPVDALERDPYAAKSFLARGTLEAIDSTVNATTATVNLKAIFSNKDNKLFPGQFVNARVQADTLRNATIIPAAAIQVGPNAETFAYVVKDDNTVEVRTVKRGPDAADGEDSAILSGLSPGETVVTDGVDKLQSGAKVAPEEQPMTPPGGATTRSSTTRPAGSATHRHRTLDASPDESTSQPSP